MTRKLSLNDAVLIIQVGTFATTIRAGEISHCWDGISMRSDRRALSALESLHKAIFDFSEYVSQMKSEGGTIDVDSEVETFARRAVQLHRAAWSADSQTMSPMVTGGSNFPVARNRKRMNTARKRWDEVRDHMAKARDAVKRRAWPHGAPGDPVRGNNPEALTELESRIAERKAEHDKMKRANLEIRKGRKNEESDAELIARLVKVGYSTAIAAQLIAPPYPGAPVGFTFSLTNNNSEIRRLEKRLEELREKRSQESSESDYETTEGRVTLCENVEADRLQLFFPGKPTAETRAVLKSAGFRWSPSFGAWQRHLNNAGRYAASSVLDKIKTEKESES